MNRFKIAQTFLGLYIAGAFTFILWPAIHSRTKYHVGDCLIEYHDDRTKTYSKITNVGKYSYEFESTEVDSTGVTSSKVDKFAPIKIVDKEPNVYRTDCFMRGFD